jgi:preprotein translocase subunit SecF
MTAPVRTGSVWSRLYNGETDIEFIGRWKRWFLISGLVILVGLVSLLTRGLNLGIEFEGGVSWQVPVGEATVESMRDAVAGAGLEDATVQTVGTGDSERLRIKSELAEDQSASDITAAIAEEAGVDQADVTQQAVSKSWGDQITSKAQRALVIFLVLVSLYIAFRFEWKMALATLVALLHDILVTVGVYSLFGFEVTPATVIAILTILGYSIYDGIVVFDRVDENAQALAVSGSSSYSEMVNDSLNQVLMRTLNTSITALLPILSLLVLGSMVLGATTLQDFALALFIGLASGAYSSIFIASPTLALLKEREERWIQVRERLVRIERRSAPAPVVGAVAVTDVVDDVEDAPAPTAPSRPPTSTTKIPPAIQPRGRKKPPRRK